MDKPDMDPHEFEPTSADAKIYQKANVIISNGGGFDNWSVNFAKQNTDAKAINLAKLYDFEGEHDHDHNKKHPWLLAIPAVAVVGMIGMVIFTSISRTEKADQTGKIKVIASLDSYGEMAKAVLGNQGSVTSIMTLMMGVCHVGH
ncbi:zinc ABC transporter substrate-binding protein [Weissella confusa]|uniref:Zinc ABC transporter substrate-binding protein n=1 Tax=Weissella confusa TaxID=1583 RepID=A0A923NHV6_WEICO|nr:zinc ABC transporter substrate-binding protein [Weissella confusa]